MSTQQTLILSTLEKYESLNQIITQRKHVSPTRPTVTIYAYKHKCVEGDLILYLSTKIKVVDFTPMLMTSAQTFDQIYSTSHKFLL